MTEAYPLHWPPGWPRTPYNKQQSSRFTTTMHKATKKVLDELRLLGARHLVVSSNVPVRRDGLPYSNYSRRAIEDQGAAVYFMVGDRQQCIPCDKWQYVHDNIHAIALCINAMRGLERWGAKSMVDAAFRGFEALPPPAEQRPWWLVLRVDQWAKLSEIEAAYREAAKKAHPDTGGSRTEWDSITAAYEQARRARQ